MKANKTLPKVIAKIAAMHEVDLSKVGSYFRVESSGYMPLAVERVDTHLISVAHYGEMNGDSMADPEMLFWDDTIDGSWIPVSFRNDYAALVGFGPGGRPRFATTIKEGKIVSFYPAEQADQAHFAAMWARNLVAQGFTSKNTRLKWKG